MKARIPKHREFIINFPDSIDQNKANDLLQLCPALVGLGVVNSVGEVDDKFTVLRNTSFHK